MNVNIKKKKFIGNLTGIEIEAENAEEALDKFWEIVDEDHRALEVEVKEKDELTAHDYELLALSRMTGEQIAMELNDKEREEYYKLLEGEDVSEYCPTCGTELEHITIGVEDVFGCPKCKREVPRDEAIIEMKENTTAEAIKMKKSEPGKQKFDPFGKKDTTICGDCGKILTEKTGRLEDSNIDRGVRCNDCYPKFIEKCGK
jgi:DNA-directed RNA polymerase subunit M/transcription elongation factor TFIIS